MINKSKKKAFCLYVKKKINMSNNKNTILIGFAGPAKSGKTYMANTVKEHYGLNRAEIISFADPIRDMLSVLVGSDIRKDELKEIPHKNLCNQTIRRAMQTLGTEWGLNLIGKDIWVNVFEKKISQTKAQLVLVPDVRFDIEAESIFKNNGKILYLSPNEELHSEIDESNHISESGLSVNILDKCIHLTNNFDKESISFVLNNYLIGFNQSNR